MITDSFSMKSFKVQQGKFSQQNRTGKNTAELNCQNTAPKEANIPLLHA